jgi:hypothetical protein
VSQRAILVTILLLGITPLSFLALYRWDIAQNRGFEFGYFGVFNQFRYALSKVPGVTVVEDWAHEDVTLEEFRFDLVTDNGRSVRLWIGETDPIRSLSGEKLRAALAARIEEKAPPAKPNP